MRNAVIQILGAKGDELRLLSRRLSREIRDAQLGVPKLLYGTVENEGVKGAGVDTFIEVVAVASIPGLVALLGSFAGRNKGRTIKISCGENGRSIEVHEGYDSAEVERLIELLEHECAGGTTEQE
jgi:hypothetical protein